MTRTNENDENSNETDETTTTTTSTTTITTTSTEHINEDSLNETDIANRMEIPSFFKESCIEGQECCKDKVMGM